MLRDSYRTKCGGVLVLPPKTKEHMAAHREVGDLIEEATARLQLPKDGSFLATEIDFGRVIGRSGCVATQPVAIGEKTLFAKRVARDKPSRVVVGREGPETTKLVVLAFADKAVRGQYVLITAYVGELAPKEPWDRSMVSGSAEAVAALEFWCCHALVHDPAVMGQPFEATWQEILSS